MAVSLSVLACGTLEIGIEQSVAPAPSATMQAAALSAPVFATPSATPTAASTHAPTLAAPTTPERILFGPGDTSYIFSVNLTSGVPKTYLLQIQARQQMTVTTTTNVTITVLAAQDKPVTPTTAQPGQWAGTVPASGQYRLVLLGEGPAMITVNIPPGGS